MALPNLKTVYINKTAEEIIVGEPIGDLQYITKDFILVKEELIVFTPAEYEAHIKSIIPEFISKIDWELLRDQKDWLLNNSSNKAMGIAYLIDAIQDYAVDEVGIDENVVFKFEEE